MPGIKKDETMPIAMLSPEFGGGLVGLAGAALMPTATMYLRHRSGQGLRHDAAGFPPGKSEGRRRDA